jgi:hypothetical protein
LFKIEKFQNRINDGKLVKKEASKNKTDSSNGRKVVFNLEKNEEFLFSKKNAAGVGKVAENGENGVEEKSVNNKKKSILKTIPLSNGNGLKSKGKEEAVPQKKKQLKLLMEAADNDSAGEEEDEDMNIFSDDDDDEGEEEKDDFGVDDEEEDEDEEEEEEEGDEEEEEEDMDQEEDEDDEESEMNGKGEEEEDDDVKY